MKTFVLMVTVLALGALSLGETPAAAKVKAQREATAELSKDAAMESVAHSPLSTTCAFTFTTGSQSNSLQYCVTANGNIIDFETPLRHALISKKDFAEGYGICDAASGVEYRDFGGLGDSGNWGTATVVSHNSKSVQIARTTSDGLWTLTQTIAEVTGTSPAAQITMALKNNSSVAREAIVLRYADVDADSDVLNNFDATVNSAMGWNSVSTQGSGQPFGLVLQNIGTTKFDFDGFAQAVPDPPPTCKPFTNFRTGVQASVDGSVVMLYDIVGIQKSATATVTVAYRGW